MEKNVNEAIFKFIFNNAMKDAVMMGAYTFEKKWLYSRSDVKEKEDIKKVVINILETHVKKIVNGEYSSISQNCYDKEFVGVAKNITDEINKVDQGEFTFGNAQKLINMTIKYCYIRFFEGDLKESRKRFKVCHCPLDKQMLKKVWDEQKVSLKYTQANFLMSWGKEVLSYSHSNPNIPQLPTRYSAFQIAVRKIIKKCKEKGEGPQIPIEYDYCEWND